MKKLSVAAALLVSTLVVCCSDSTSCKNGKELDNRCYPNNCTHRICPPQSVCGSDDTCIEIACMNKECDIGELCTSGECYPKNCLTKNCPGLDEICVEEECVQAACINVQCPTTQKCLNGYCYPKDCAAKICLSVGEVCQKDKCVSEACVLVKCPEEQQCAPGYCRTENCSIPYKQHIVPGSIQFVDFDLGGECIASHDTTPDTNEQTESLGTHEAYRPAELGPDIGWRDNVGYMLGSSYAGEWVRFSQVDVQQGGTYTVDFVLSSDRTGNLNFRVDGLDVVTVNYNASSDPWNEFNVFSAQAALTRGKHTFEVYHNVGFADAAMMDFRL
jgi:hypothetical protein